MAFLIGDQLAFAAPPKCGCTWTLAALTNGNVPLERKASTKAHIPIWPKDVVTVTVRRDPVSWLRSYYQNMQGRKAQVPEVDCFQDLDFSQFKAFVESYASKHPGGITRMFDRYKADIVIELNDLTEKMAELVEHHFPSDQFPNVNAAQVRATAVDNATPEAFEPKAELREIIEQAEGVLVG